MVVGGWSRGKGQLCRLGHITRTRRLGNGSVLVESASAAGRVPTKQVPATHQIGITVWRSLNGLSISPSRRGSMSRLLRVTLAWAVLSMAACGSKSANNATTGTAKSSPAAPLGPASAEQVAKENRGNVKCPANVPTAQPAGAQVDDVTGVRPGMSWDDAANLVLCDNPLMVVTENPSRGYNINTYGQHIRQGFDGKFAEPRVVSNPQQTVAEMMNQSLARANNAYATPLPIGQSRYFVSTMGLPGQERVLSVAREESFAEGKQPTVDSLKQALIAKYGEPSQENDNGVNSRLYWEYDPSGAKITQGSPRLGICRIDVGSDAATSLSTGCGLTVGAGIEGARNNPGLAHSFAVTSQNGAQGMAALKSIEDALKLAADARKAKELNDASKHASTPKL